MSARNTAIRWLDARQPGLAAGPGAGAGGGFYDLVFRGPLAHPLVLRYFAGHPINMVETALFFVGLVALVHKLLEPAWAASVARRAICWATSRRPAGEQSQRVARCTGQLSAPVRDSYLGRRLTDALEPVERNGSADSLEDDLKYLSEVDAGRAHDSYGLVRIVIWAMPMLGFLGTVVGITDALGELDGRSWPPRPTRPSTRLTAGLYVAFDTTAIALCFSIVLMFIQFMLDRWESQLLVSGR